MHLWAARIALLAYLLGGVVAPGLHSHGVHTNAADVATHAQCGGHTHDDAVERAEAPKRSEQPALSSETRTLHAEHHCLACSSIDAEGLAEFGSVASLCELADQGDKAVELALAPANFLLWGSISPRGPPQNV